MLDGLAGVGLVEAPFDFRQEKNRSIASSTVASSGKSWTAWITVSLMVMTFDFNESPTCDNLDLEVRVGTLAGAWVLQGRTLSRIRRAMALG
jgi:hypothetical protein